MIVFAPELKHYPRALRHFILHLNGLIVIMPLRL